jgi:hypothetical protein
MAARNASTLRPSASISGSTSARLSMKMSRHIAGLDAATRVVSRALVVGNRRSPSSTSGESPPSVAASV